MHMKGRSESMRKELKKLVNKVKGGEDVESKLRYYLLCVKLLLLLVFMLLWLWDVNSKLNIVTGEQDSNGSFILFISIYSLNLNTYFIWFFEFMSHFSACITFRQPWKVIVIGMQVPFIMSIEGTCKVSLLQLLMSWSNRWPSNIMWKVEITSNLLVISTFHMMLLYWQ